MRQRLMERFLRYVTFDTRSDPSSMDCPSTPGQFIFLTPLAAELRTMGAADVYMDSNGYVTAAIPASEGCEESPVIGFLAHADTSPDMPGDGVKPRLTENYGGGDIPLGEGYVMRVADFPELARLKGQTLITTDGTTLLGADDKAGVAIVMTAAEHLLSHSQVRHGRIRIAFTPDEEIGRGADRFDVERFGADWAYTVDGGAEGELEYENFNAAEAKVFFRGDNIHPGYAKGKMVNALLAAADFVSMLPAAERPENTEDREGFFHLTRLDGDVSRAEAEIIIRDHSAGKFAARKALLKALTAEMDRRYGREVAQVVIRDQYLNMLPVIEQYPEVVDRALKAMKLVGVTPVVKPVRGGTDGARLSHMGLPCPNLFTGGGNFHSRYEYCSVEAMLKAVNTVLNICYL